MKKIVSLLLVFCMILTFTACSTEEIINRPIVQNFIKTIHKEEIEADFGEDPIKVGIFEPQTGKFYAEGQEEIKGIKLANFLYPSIGDRQIQLIYADNQSTAGGAKVAAQELIDEGCKIILGSYSNILTMAAMDIFEENQIVCICPSCTNPLITTTSDYMFRVAVVDSFEGNSAAKYIIEYLPKVLHPAVADDPETEEDESVPGGEPVNCVILKRTDDEKASVLIERFQSKMESVFGTDGYVTVVEYPAVAEDMTDYLIRIKNLGAEAVFFPSSAAEGERVLKEAFDEGFEFSWVGNSDWAGLQAAAENAARADQEHLEGACYVAAFDKKAAATDVTTLFISAAQSYYGDSEPSENMALAFDAYLLAYKALSLVEDSDSGVTLQIALDHLREYDCATGSITYMAGNGDPVKDVVIEKIKDGKIMADYTATPVWE